MVKERGDFERMTTILELKKIIFEKKKVPYYITQSGGRVTLNVIDKEGYHIYTHGKDRKLILINSTPLNNLLEEDIALIFDKIGTKLTEKVLKE